VALATKVRAEENQTSRSHTAMNKRAGEVVPCNRSVQHH
jgi:hypothetical protein